jgi:PIN domain nuclease of toxin-antitoxin system
VNLLLDTCTFLWLVLGSSRLSARAARLIADPDNLRWLCVISVWEIAVLFSSGRFRLPSPPQQFVRNGCGHHDIDLRWFFEADAFLEPGLPRIHRDPSDRMLVCQALSHGLTIVTPDPQIRRYPIPTAW